MRTIKQDFDIQRSVDVNGIVSVLTVKAIFNNKNGQFKINPQITTNQVGDSDEEKNAVVSQLGAMVLEAMNEMYTMRLEWKAENDDTYDPNQLTMSFEPEDGTYPADQSFSVVDAEFIESEEEPAPAGRRSRKVLEM